MGTGHEGVWGEVSSAAVNDGVVVAFPDAGDGSSFVDDDEETPLLSTASETQSAVTSQWYRRGGEVGGDGVNKSREMLESKRELKSLGLYTDAKLVWIAIALISVYMAIGCTFYVAHEHALIVNDVDETQSLIDAFYFVTVTLSTVGYGDVHPQHTTPKVFTSIFILFGVIVVGYCVGVVVVEVREIRRHRTKEELARAELELFEPGGILHDCADAQQSRWERLRADVGPLLKAFLIMLLTIGIGMVIIYLDDTHTSADDALYFAAVSVTTVGFGDLRVHTTGGKAAIALFSLVATAAFGQALATIASFPIAYRQRMLQERVLKQHGTRLAMHDLNDVMFANRNSLQPYITREEFTLRLLLRMNKITHEDVRLCHEQFAVLDADHNLRLDQRDVLDEDKRAQGHIASGQ